jgi:hypothetical protein
MVRFRPGAGDQLLRLAPLLRPLIELHWTRMVAGINRINLEDDRLRAHLFGTERTTFPAALRAGLAELQDHACFYCDDTLSARAQVDHVLPWARQPNDAVENLVLADRCNTAKRDHLPALVHVDRWAHVLSHARGTSSTSQRQRAGRATRSARSRSCARPTPTSPPALRCGSATISSPTTTPP